MTEKGVCELVRLLSRPTASFLVHTDTQVSEPYTHANKNNI